MLHVWNTFTIKQSKIADASLNDRNNYVSALERIQKDLRFKQKDSLSALRLFTNELVGDEYQPVEEIKWFKYRYSLLVDSLYIFAFQDKKKGKRILNYLKTKINVRYHKKLDELFGIIYNKGEGTFEDISVQLENWKANQNFEKKPLKRIAFVANMSAGKSTLINALTGKEINSSKTSSCTRKLHFVYSKPYEDGYICENDCDINFNADKALLMEDNEKNLSNIISVGTAFDSENLYGERYCFIDTPGVNAEDEKLRQVSYNLIKSNDYDLLVFIFNAQNIATTSDGEYLNFIKDNVDIKKVILAINKFDVVDDSDIKQNYKEKIVEYLFNMGIKNVPIVYMSSKAAYLAKNNQNLSTRKRFEFEQLLIDIDELCEYFTERNGDIFNASGIKQLETMIKEHNND